MIGRADLQQLMQRYGAYVQDALGGKYVAMTAKWPAEDLVPGLSDIDFRVVLAEGAVPGDWVVADRACGEIHARVACERPDWWRMLEHTPGCGLSLGELRREQWYHPEYHTWQACHGDAGQIQAVLEEYGKRPWDRRDEDYHLGRFLETVASLSGETLFEYGGLWAKTGIFCQATKMKAHMD